MNSIDLNSNFKIRAATLADEALIRQLHLAAFGAEENEQVARLLHWAGVVRRVSLWHLHAWRL